MSFLYSHNLYFYYFYGRIFVSFPFHFSFTYCLVVSPITVILPTLTLTLLLKDVDKTQTEIMRHHTSISELKRSFMESVPESRPSEWDKRLSINLPFCTASINGQLQAVVSPPKWVENTQQQYIHTTIIVVCNGEYAYNVLYHLKLYTDLLLGDDAGFLHFIPLFSRYCSHGGTKHFRTFC